MDNLHARPAPEPPPGSRLAPLPAGTVIAGRFTLQALAGRGGMGAVYRAMDSLSGQPVALKLLQADSSEALQRFTREASVLASLRHPGIVSYVAHGVAEGALPFLAMQWLEGEDLAQRLARQPLRLEETLALVRRTAQALTLAHAHGVIHRDLKPSNLFLRQGRPEDTVLLDFGLARHVLPSTALTASQMVVGTPGYMAPEQASGQSLLTPSADLFSLGCILYECLTGTPPFSAPHFVAALAKVLFARPAPLNSLRPDLPGALQELLDQLLAKNPALRFPEASRLLTALDSFQARLEQAPAPLALLEATPLRLAQAEQHLVSVLLATPRARAAQEPGGPGSQRELFETLRSLLTPHGAQVELLADGALVATLAATHGSATDPAPLMARCALLLQERWPQAAVVLTTGLFKLDPHLPMGEAMDRAGQLLRQLELLPDGSSSSVMLDEVTAGQLGPHFQLSRSQPGLFLLLGEHLDIDESRPLLGKPTPCVGREQELALLELALSACVQEPTAQAVLIKAPAGAGKSRLRHEFLRRLKRLPVQPVVLLGRGDPLNAGAANGLLSQALRRWCNLSHAEPLELQRERLTQRLAQHLPVAQRQEMLAFLGELCGIAFSDEHNPKLRAARGDPRMMSTWLGRAWVAFLQAECAHHPVLLVLEDLHWGDPLSIRLLEEALRELAEQPFMVLALARPELAQVMPESLLRRFQEVPLRGLSRKAGARLVREVLGPQVPDSLMDRLVEQAAGNALFLEELIRGAAEGHGEEAPATVLAILQGRLGRLEPDTRQVLLAASFLGRSFWAGGVRALLGEEPPTLELEDRLRSLVEQEWVEPQRDSRFPGQDEYRFRHALVRDAAYGLVPDSHKPTGHRLAGQWLEHAGESNPRVLAEHAAQARQLERAILFYTRAAEQSFQRFDLPGMDQCVEAALLLEPSEEPRVQLRALQASAAFWKGDIAKLFEMGGSLLSQLRPGSPPWYWLSTGLYLGAVLGGAAELAAGIGQGLLQARPEPSSQGACLEALGAAANANIWFGDRQASSAFRARLAEVCAETTPETLLERGWMDCVKHHFSFYLEPQPWQACVQAEQTYQGFLEMGLERNTPTALTEWARTLEALSERTRAEAIFRESLIMARRLGHHFSIPYCELHLALFLADSPEPEPRREALVMASGSEFAHIPLFAGLAHTLKAKLAMGRGEWVEAEAEALKACDVLTFFHFHRLSARTLLSQVLLVQGRASEARQAAVLAVQALEQCGSEGTQSVAARLALAEACLTEGDVPAGEAALRRALQGVRERARDIPEESTRQHFLSQVPENARVLELARQRWGELP